MPNNMRSGGARYGIVRRSSIVRQAAMRPAVIGFAVLLTACGSIQQAEIDKPSAPAAEPQKKVVRVAALKPAESTVGLAGVTPSESDTPAPQTLSVQQALAAYHGAARYICSPSGFGQTSNCRLRGRSG